MTRLVAIPLPNAAPILRMLVFMPVATPVCSAGTASMIRFAMLAKPIAIPIPSNPVARYIVHSWLWATTRTT